MKLLKNVFKTSTQRGVQTKGDFIRYWSMLARNWEYDIDNERLIENSQVCEVGHVRDEDQLW